MGNWVPREDPDARTTLMQCYNSLETCARVLFPSRFRRPFTSLHRQIFNILDDLPSQKVAIAAPRSIGKTSLVSLAYAGRQILFEDSKFIMNVSYSNSKAEKETENLKDQLVRNVRIQELFAPMKSDSWSKESWVTATGTMVMPRGRGQQIRGWIHGDYRPDLFIVDDLEDPEEVNNDERRFDTKQWFFEDLYGAVDKAEKDWRIIVVGTILHEDALLVNLLEDPGWHSIRLELCDDNYKSNCPEWYSDEDILAMVEDYRNQGLLDSFYREYRNLVIAGEDAAFQSSMFKYYDEGEARLDKDLDVENFVIIDPAKTTAEKSDDTAIVGIGHNAKKNRLYFRDCVAGKFHPDRQYEEVFRMCERLRARVIGIEVTSLNEFITQPFYNEMNRRGLSYTVVELKPRGGEKKDDRIRGLVPYYRQGLVFHNKAISGALEAQLLSFPKSKRKDVMDAFAYVVQLLQTGERYMRPKTWAKNTTNEAYARLREQQRATNRRLKPSWMRV